MLYTENFSSRDHFVFLHIESLIAKVHLLTSSSTDKFRSSLSDHNATDEIEKD